MRSSLRAVLWPALGAMASWVGAQETAPAPTLAVYDVRDLADFAQKLEPEAAPGSGADALAAAVAAFLRPPAGADAVRVAHGALVLVGTPVQHAWVNAFLARQRRGLDRTLRLEGRLYRLPADLVARFGLRAEQVLLGEPAQVAALRRQAERQGGETAALPPLELRPLQSGALEAMKDITYIKEWQLHVGVEPGNATIIDPVLDVVRNGVAVQCRAVLLERQAIGLSLVLSRSDVQRPIPSRRIEIVPGKPRVEVAEPRVDVLRVRVTLSVQPAHTVVLALPARAGVRTVVLLRVESSSD